MIVSLSYLALSSRMKPTKYLGKFSYRNFSTLAACRAFRAHLRSATATGNRLRKSDICLACLVPKTWATLPLVRIHKNLKYFVALVHYLRCYNHCTRSPVPPPLPQSRDTGENYLANPALPRLFTLSHQMFQGLHALTHESSCGRIPQSSESRQARGQREGAQNRKR